LAEAAMSDDHSPLGSIEIYPQAIATIAYHATRQSYGVVGLASKNLVGGLAQMIVNDPTFGIEVHFDGQRIHIDLYIIIEYGTRIKTVADSVRNSVRYHVEKAIGMPINQVNVHVQGLRISNLD
jgi:uncharacterized alkaline shock family protein YloU